MRETGWVKWEWEMVCISRISELGLFRDYGRLGVVNLHRDVLVETADPVPRQWVVLGPGPGLHPGRVRG